MVDIILTGKVTADHKLVFDSQLPPDAPIGMVEIAIRPLIKIDENYGKRPVTAGEIRRSPLFGMWADRDDIGDSVEYVNRMRKEQIREKFQCKGA
jgi:hypothetical protein